MPSEATVKEILGATELAMLRSYLADAVKVTVDGGSYIAKSDYPGLQKMDMFGRCAFFALRQWLEHPVLFTPTVEQQEALKHVEINLPVADFEAPFSSTCIDVLKSVEFTCVFVHRMPELIIVVALSRAGKGDCVYVINGVCLDSIESWLERGDHDPVKEVVRVALNCCLLLTNAATMTQPAHPKVLAQDTKWAEEASERGLKAKERVRNAYQRITFVNPVEVVATSKRRSEEGGSPVAPHWVRGHWRMQAHGPRFELRKRIFVKLYTVGVVAESTSVKEYRSR